MLAPPERARDATAASAAASSQPSLVIANGPLGGRLAFVMAAGVPGYILDFATAGPGLRNIGDGWLYEVDRPTIRSTC